MPALRAGRVGAAVGVIFMGLACGLPPGAAVAEPDSGSDSSSESGNAKSDGPGSGTDAGGRNTPTRVGPNASDDDISTAEDFEDKAWQDADKASADLDASLRDTIASMSGGVDKSVLQEAASRMREDQRVILEAARADEKAGLELLRLHEPQVAPGSISGQGAAPSPQVQGLAAQHQRSKEAISGAVEDRKTAVESIQGRDAGNVAKLAAAAELMAQGTSLTSAAATQSSEFDRIMAGALTAEAQATSTGQGQTDQSANINEMMALSADVRAKLQEIANAQTAALESIARD